MMVAAHLLGGSGRGHLGKIPAQDEILLRRSVGLRPIAKSPNRASN